MVEVYSVLSEISGSHGGEYKVYGLLGRTAVQSSRY
jgi:hypothetical protein